MLPFRFGIHKYFHHERNNSFCKSCNFVNGFLRVVMLEFGSNELQVMTLNMVVFQGNERNKTLLLRNNIMALLLCVSQIVTSD